MKIAAQFPDFPPPKFQDHFWSNVNIGERFSCWEWMLSTNDRGYGKIHVPGVGLRYAHRVAYWLHNGVAPADLCVCHSCDNPLCCNPSHLWLGTAQENVSDAMKKGRSVKPPVTDWAASMKAKPHHWAKLDARRVDIVRCLIAVGMKDGEIAKIIGVGDKAIWKIRHKQRWAHVPETVRSVDDARRALSLWGIETREAA